MITKQQLLIAKDKANHIVYGSIITVFSALVSIILILLLSVNSSTVYLSAIPGVFAAGLVEYLDWKTKKGTPELKDFWSTVLGVALVYVPLALFAHFIT